MKILIADKLPEEVVRSLSQLGFEVDFQPTLSAEAIPAMIPDAHILVVRSTRVTRESLIAADKLQLIIRAGAGTNTIDCATASQRGVFVANCPGKNAIAVAELAMGLILSLDRRIPDNVSELRNGVWDKSRFGKAQGLYGRCLGIVGLGRIGCELLLRAQAFGLECVAWSRSLTPERARELGVTRMESVLELCQRADIVSVHVALTDNTRHLIGSRELGAMKPNSYLVNLSRGGVVDDEALKQAIEEGRLRAASDVYELEPKGGQAVFDNPLGECGDFYGTHHIGASTEQAQMAIANEVLRIVQHWVGTGEALNCVNLAVESPTSGQLLVRHLDRVGVLATVLDVLKRAEINVQEMRNIIFDGGDAACAKISVEQAPSADLLATLNACSPDVLGVEFIAGT
jgi:D-3-phosphoglycerate dehydrogenase